MSISEANDLFIAGIITVLQEIKSLKEQGDCLADIDFDHLIETQRRNLNNPRVLDSIITLKRGLE